MPSRMRILQICDSASWGGLEIYFVRLVNSLGSLLEELGGEVLVYCRRGSSIDRRTRYSKLYSLKEIGNVPSVDIVHIHRSADLWKGVLIKELVHASLLFTNHMGSKVWKKDPFHRLIYSKVDHILAISNTVRAELLNCLPVESRRISVLHLGVNQEEFRRKGKRKSDSMLIGCTSRIEPAKGQRELILAFNRVAKDYPTARLELAGKVMSRSYYEELQRIKTDGISFLGTLEDVRPFLEKLDIYVFPSHGEAFGLALCEAMAFELPCIAYKERGPKEIIKNGRSGILVEKGNIGELEEALRMLIENPFLRRRFGREARKRIESKFNWRKHIDELLGYYEYFGN